MSETPSTCRNLIRLTIAVCTLLYICLLPLQAFSAPGKVVLQLKWFHQFQFAGYYAAIDQGYYADVGLDVELREGAPEINFIDNLLSDEADYLVYSPGALLHRSKGKKIVALASIFQHSPLVFLSLRDSGILSPTDLAGRRVMVDDVFDSELLAMCRNEGVDLDRLIRIPNSWNIQDLILGRVDAMSAYLTDANSLLTRQNADYRILNPLTYGIDFYGDILFTSEDEIHQHPERVLAFRNASLKGWHYAMEHPNEIIDLLLRTYGSHLTREELQFEAEVMKTLILPDLVAIGHMNPGRWQHIVNSYIFLDMLPKDFSLQGFLYDPTVSPRSAWLHQLLIVLAVTIFAAVCLVTFLYIYNRQLRSAVVGRTKQLTLTNLNLQLEMAERERAATALHESELRFRSLVDNIPGVVYRCAADKDRMVQFLSGEAEVLTGYSVSDFVDSRLCTLSSIIHPDDRAEIVQIVTDKIDRCEPYSMEYRIIHRDGQIRWLNENGQPITNEQGDILCLDGVLLDVTEHKLMQAQTIRSAQLASLGEMAAGVAHEINNPINGVINYAQILTNRCEEGSEEKGIAERIMKEGDRIATIVKNLLTVAHDKDECYVPGHVIEVLTDALSISAVTMRKDGIQVTIDIDPQLPSVIMHAQHIHQVFLNLLSNARYALSERYPGADERKIIDIKGELVTIDQHSYVRVTFLDHGTGIPEDLKEKVMHPFITTKPAGVGTGLGLSISHEIIKKHRGFLALESQLGEYTQFTVDLPVAT